MKVPRKEVANVKVVPCILYTSTACLHDTINKSGCWKIEKN